MGLAEFSRASVSGSIQPIDNEGAYTGKRSEFMHADEVGKIVRTGDLIEFKRYIQLGKIRHRVYTHWGVYVGEHDGVPTVAHMFITRQSVNSAYKAVVGDLKAAEVRLDSLAEVCTATCRINNLDDRRYEQLDAAAIFKRALAMLGQHNYNILYDNCEHFAKWCRYDKHTSNQVTRWQGDVSNSIGWFWKAIRLASLPSKVITSVVPFRL